MWRDLRYAIHGLRRSPTFTVAVTVSLGLAIGANATIFGAIDALWLRPPGGRNPGDLVRVFSTSQASRDGLWSFPDYRDLRDGTQGFDGVAARGRRGTLLQLPDGTSELELVNIVSLNFFSVLGIEAAAGRLFGPGDAQALERAPGVVLGHAFWQRQYGGDAAIVGRSITLGRFGRGAVPVTVLGVLPERFRDLEAAADRDLWLPPQTWQLLGGPDELEQRDFRWLDIIARRRPGTGVAQASAEVASVAQALAHAHPANRGRGGRVVSVLAHRLETGGINALALLGLVLLVVGITCVNVANLQIARAGARARELGVRIALGASRGRLVRQLMTENVLLGAIGSAAGLLITAWIIRLLPGIIGTPPGFRAMTVFALDGRVFLFTLAVTMVTTIAFGLAPSLLAARTDVVAVLKGDAGLLRSPLRHTRVRTALVAAQIAVAVIMLTAAGLLARSFSASGAANLGFSRTPRLVAWVAAEIPRAAGDDISLRLRALPGVRDVAVALRAPLSLTGGGLAHPVIFPGGEPNPPGGFPEVKFNAVSSNYFEVMGTRVIQGRAFSDADERGGEPVMIVSAHFARRFFPGTPALEHVVRVGGPEGVEHRIIGIAEDIAINAVGEEVEPYFYLPFWRGRYTETTFLVNAHGDAASLASAARDTLRSTDPRFDPRLLSSMDELVRFSTRNYRWTALLAAVLGALGLLLTALGVYGVVAFNTAMRTREIGIRVALGAGRGTVLRLVLRDGLGLAAAGVAIGVPGAFFVARALSSMLFGIGPIDVPSFVAAIVAVVAIVAAATIIPARRAVRVIPSIALRNS